MIDLTTYNYIQYLNDYLTNIRPLNTDDYDYFCDACDYFANSNDAAMGFFYCGLIAAWSLSKEKNLGEQNKFGHLISFFRQLRPDVSQHIEEQLQNSRSNERRLTCGAG